MCSPEGLYFTRNIAAGAGDTAGGGPGEDARPVKV